MDTKGREERRTLPQLGREGSPGVLLSERVNKSSRGEG